MRIRARTARLHQADFHSAFQQGGDHCAFVAAGRFTDHAHLRLLLQPADEVLMPGGFVRHLARALFIQRVIQSRADSFSRESHRSRRVDTKARTP